jgi:hypothetical protein
MRCGTPALEGEVNEHYAIIAKNHIAGFSISPQLTGFTGPGIVR